MQGALLFQEINLPKGAVLHLQGTNSDTTRDMIKKTLVQEGLDVIFVQFCSGGSEAWVRLQGENSSKEVCDSCPSIFRLVGGFPSGIVCKPFFSLLCNCLLLRFW
jgi:hypothetical protein